MCANAEDETSDKTMTHFKRLALEGLNHLVRRDAVREGDGPAMASHWRIDMIQYWNRDHRKYRIIGHNYLASKCLKSYRFL